MFLKVVLFLFLKLPIAEIEPGTSYIKKPLRQVFPGAYRLFVLLICSLTL